MATDDENQEIAALLKCRYIARNDPMGAPREEERAGLERTSDRVYRALLAKGEIGRGRGSFRLTPAGNARLDARKGDAS